MDPNEKMATYRLMLSRQIAEAVKEGTTEGEGPHSIGVRAVELAELNGLLDPVKELYSEHH